MFIEITEDNLKEVIGQLPKTLVQFGAGWCGNCRLMKPKLKRMAQSDENVQFIYADAERFPESRKTG